jgi:hypothetical protein
MAKKDVTDDIKQSWFNPIRAAQAACRKNRGYAILTLTVLVNKNDPMLWSEPQLIKVHPAKLADYQVSPALLAAMLELADSKVDNKKDGA